jgi:hypothetical protein
MSTRRHPAGAPSLKWMKYIFHSNDKQAGSLRPECAPEKGAGQCEKADARISCRKAASL